jgi:mono/diheme cytochrome c family protein
MALERTIEQDGDASHGRKLFETGACVACHRVEGKGAEFADLIGYLRA